MPRMLFSNSTNSPACTLSNHDAGNAVTNGEHLPDLGDFGLLAEVLICSFRMAEISPAHIHQRLFHRKLDRIEFGAE